MQQNLVPRLYKHKHRGHGKLQIADSDNSALHYGLYWVFKDKF